MKERKMRNLQPETYLGKTYLAPIEIQPIPERENYWVQVCPNCHGGTSKTLYEIGYYQHTCYVECECGTHYYVYG